MLAAHAGLYIHGVETMLLQHRIYESIGRESLLYLTIGFEFARFKQPADKAPIRRYSYMSVTILLKRYDGANLHY